MAGKAGVEPANLRLTAGYITALSLAKNQMVEKVGVDPTASILQGSTAPRCFPRCWCQEEELNLRRAAFQTAALPLSYLGVDLVRVPGIEPGPHEWHSQTRPSSYTRKVW